MQYYHGNGQHVYGNTAVTVRQLSADAVDDLRLFVDELNK